MKIKINDIEIDKRIRKDLGDLKPLAASIEKFGQMNPVILTPAKKLIAGHRRIEASKLLGKECVDAVIIHDVSEIRKLEMEIDENLYRKELTDKELDDAFKQLEKLSNPGVFANFWKAIVDFFKRLFKKT